MEMKKYIEKKFSIGGDKFLLLRKLHEDGKISTEELSGLIKYYESALFMKHWEGFFTGLQTFDKDHKKIKKVVDIFTKMIIYKIFYKNINP
jgi:hypothetical protein